MKKEKIKDFVKKYLIGFILGVLSAAVVVVYAETYFPSNQVTYDNNTSGLSSTNVQTAIDELYNTCFPKTSGDQILDNVDIVTSGDGLYEDEYEDGRYFFKGKSPNNYVTFNNEKAGWRIISVEPDKTIKIMKIESISIKYWDASGSNDWARPATLNTYLNEDYYNDKLNALAKSQVVAKDWSIGAVAYNAKNMANTINNENGKKWNGKVALVTVSEYVRSNSNKNSCGTVNQLWKAISGECKETTWMYYSNDSWCTLTPASGDSNYVFYVDYDSSRISNEIVNTNFLAVRPALYLSSEVQITGGTGTQNDPFTLE